MSDDLAPAASSGGPRELGVPLAASASYVAAARHDLPYHCPTSLIVWIRSLYMGVPPIYRQGPTSFRLASTDARRADMNWFAVLAHHAHPHAGQGDHGVRGRDDHLRRDGGAGRRAGRRAAERASAGATSWASSRTTAPSSWRRSSPPTTSGIAMPINWRLAAPEVRYILEHSRRGRSCATRRSSTWPTRPPRASAALLRACTPRPEGWTTSAPTSRRSDAGAPVAVGGRRRPPPDVHVGHDRATEGRDAHPRQPGVEEPSPTSSSSASRAPTSGWPAGRSTTSARSTSPRPPR